ncbi:MAG: translation initiation factor IF-1 [Mollicutes bacterium PWAP]|nr:translation initiation factor IF-1 [Mollicutes bacterium PWAP]
MAGNGNKIKINGIVKEAFSTSDYKVELENGVIINATISGKMRVHRIRILPGDNVEVEISPFDLTKGRITYRR